MTMVEINRFPVKPLSPEEAGYGLRLYVNGHAGYATKGTDLVCAAESILVQALAGFLTTALPEQLADFSVEGDRACGAVVITAFPTRAGWDFICGAFDHVITGFFLLSKAYPKHVAVCMNVTQEVVR